jgi:DNA repair exonuclease SbcCD ATPase subunit
MTTPETLPGAPAEPDTLHLPVTAVTCLEDRAQIERTGTVHLAAGVQRLRIGPVTPLTVDRSLRAEISAEAEAGAGAGPEASASAAPDPGTGAAAGPGTRTVAPGTGADNAQGAGRTDEPVRAAGDGARGTRSVDARVLDARVLDARVLDARVIRVHTPAPPGPPGPEASELRREVDSLERERRDVRHLRTRLESALAVVQQAKADLHRDIVQSAGAGAADPERWADRLERVDEDAEAKIGELHRLRRRVHDLDEELRTARAALAATESEPPVLTAYLELVVEAAGAGPAHVRVVNLVP